jgi:hypothetical protein
MGETGVALLIATRVAKKRVESFMVGSGLCLCVGRVGKKAGMICWRSWRGVLNKVKM